MSQRRSAHPINHLFKCVRQQRMNVGIFVDKIALYLRGNILDEQTHQNG